MSVSSVPRGLLLYSILSENDDTEADVDVNLKSVNDIRADFLINDFQKQKDKETCMTA